jgi:dipeptidase E
MRKDRRVRMYLSSFRVGDHPELLVALVRPGARVAVIANAMDDASAEIRQQGVGHQVVALTDLGLEPTELDLRDYFTDGRGLGASLARYDVVWLRGGNVFMLRYALRRSGAEAVLIDALRRDALVYAGYSAGACVLAPSLRGLEAVDDATAVNRTYGSDPVWEGLGILDYAIVPHVRSPAHPESAALDLVAERYRAEGVPHRTLRDGQVLIVNGESAVIC